MAVVADRPDLAPPDPCEVAYRCHTVPFGRPRQRGRRPLSSPTCEAGALVFDTETTIDATQRLLFGSYRYLRPKEGRLVCAEEGLIFADDLPTSDSRGYRLLQRYVRDHDSEAIDVGVPRTLTLYSRTEFLERVFWPACWKNRAAIVGFNLPFDLSHLALWAGPGRNRNRRGITLTLWDNPKEPGRKRASQYRPAIHIETIDSRRARIQFTAVKKVDPGAEGARAFKGHFLDLRTLTFGLTDQSLSLKDACEVMNTEHRKQDSEGHGVITLEYVEYNRSDVRATCSLLDATLAEFEKHPIELAAEQIYSAATIGRDYLRTMGIHPIIERQPDFPPEVLGYGAAAYYGGRAEARIRRSAVPVVYTDFLSMYPTVACLLELWPFLVANRIEVEEVTPQVTQLLEDLKPEDLFDQRIWRQFVCLVAVKPNGAVLPVRARYARGESWQVGVNHFTADTDHWYALPDVVAAHLLGSQRPMITRALRLIPHGLAPALMSTSIRHEVSFDPTTEDFFRRLIEQRLLARDRSRQAGDEADRLQGVLKTIANSVAYGIQAETQPRDIPRGSTEAMSLWGHVGKMEISTEAPEEGRNFCFMPLAACITASARLMLALLERCISDMGGTYAMCDTDSMAIVASESGGVVPLPGWNRLDAAGQPGVHALTWDEVRGVSNRFAALNPYGGPAAATSVLKLEPENFDGTEQRQLYCLAISAKRYCLFNYDGGDPTIRKASDHGLGHLLNPMDPINDPSGWTDAVWLYLLRSELGREVTAPSFFARPAVGRITVTTDDIRKLFRTSNDGLEYRDQIKPYNFLLTAFVAPFGHPSGSNPMQFQLVTSYDRVAETWLGKRWLDRYSGDEFTITIEGRHGGRGVARVKTIGDVVAEYRVRPELKSAGADGRVCRRDTVGSLQRRHVHPSGERYIGKEARRLDDMESGVLHLEEEGVTAFGDVSPPSWEDDILPWLRSRPIAEIASAMGVHPRKVKEWRAGRSRPRNLSKLWSTWRG